MTNDDSVQDSASAGQTEISRVFVSGLPPKFTSEQLATHFGSNYKVTDAHVIADRRIGFVGFVDSTAAQNAAQHFNRTYIRMSRITVDLAKPVEFSRAKGGNPAPVFQRTQREHTVDESRKRKRAQRDDGEDLRVKMDSQAQITTDKNATESTEVVPPAVGSEDNADLDWLRGRTNRTLDLVDPDEVQIRQDADESPVQDTTAPHVETEQSDNSSEAVVKIPNARLFLRNLAFSVNEQDLRQHFQQFGKVQEVSHPFSLYTTPFVMIS